MALPRAVDSLNALLNIPTPLPKGQFDDVLKIIDGDRVSHALIVDKLRCWEERDGGPLWLRHRQPDRAPVQHFAMRLSNVTSL